MAEADRGFLRGRRIHTSFLQGMPFARRRYRAYLPLMPLAIESFDLSGFDLVLSSSFAVAKGVLTGPDQVHVGYVHSPMRYAWDMQHAYLRESGLDRGLRGFAARLLLQRMREWDYRTANGVDLYIANSRFIARRIRKTYRRDSEVVYPPVDTDYFQPGPAREGYYVTASRLVPYKRVGLIVEAFARLPQRRLVVIGDGPELAAIRARAPRNVEMLGRQPREVLRDHLQRAKAFVFAAIEDFGIAPVEAQACGTPVIALGRGGVTESVVDGGTGLFFDEQTVAALVAAIERFEGGSDFDPQAIRARALGFGAQQFKTRLTGLVDEALRKHREGRDEQRPAAWSDASPRKDEAKA
jgi:glycosyltransferase involved in cell wall biosynthesis